MGQTVRAQRMANETNLQIAQETNQMQRDLAQEANELNYQMFNEQNEWNKNMWDLQNAYNDPSAQIDRLVKAGINPIYGMGMMDSGNAQQLTSADAKPAEVAQLQRAEVNPEYNPMLAQHVGNMIAVARDTVNAALGFGQMDLKARDVATREKAQISQSMLNRASAAEKRANITGKEIENQWNLQTFSTRVSQESQKLQNMHQQYLKMDADTEQAKSMKFNLDASTDLYKTKMFEISEQLKMQKEQLKINWMNANTSAGELQVHQGQLNLADERFSSEIKKWNNDSLMQFMYKFGQQIEGGMSAKVGVEGLGLTGSASSKQVLPAAQAKMFDCGIELINRAAENPFDAKLQDQAAQAAEILNQLNPSAHVQAPDGRDNHNMYDYSPYNSSNTSVLNPSDF